MLEERDTRPGGGTPRRAEAEANRAGVNFCCDCTTPANKGQFKIAPLLGHGEQNATTTAQLMALTGHKTARSLRAAIEAERRAGALILSTVKGRGGYFLPDDGEKGVAEVKQFIRTVSARARNSFLTLQAARRSLSEVTGQTSLLSEGGEGNAEEKIYPGT